LLLLTIILIILQSIIQIIDLLLPTMELKFFNLVIYLIHYNFINSYFPWQFVIIYFITLIKFIQIKKDNFVLLNL